MQVQHGLSQIVSLIISYYLPIENEMMKMQVGFLLSGVFYTLVNSNHMEKIKNFIWKRNTHVIINEKINNKNNPIYDKLETYVIDKYVSNVNSCELVPKKGNIVFQINNNDFREVIKDKYNGKILEISFSGSKKKEKSDKENDLQQSFGNKSVIVESKYATQEELKTYVVDICKFEKNYTNILHVWRTTVEHFGKSDVINWEETKCQTNKNCKNTIVSKKVEQEFFDDVKWFLNNESWYFEKGLPYKRGYILYGPPGTGKTSLLKTIANEYNLPIFTLDFETVKSNDDLMKLMGELHILSQNRKFILSLEDVDRSPLFSRGYYNDCRVTKDCLLNVLDGIMESYGRLVVLTCNDIDVIKRIPAFHRPGRIDKCILISYCDKTQIKRLIKNFYDVDIDESSLGNINNLTPADLIKMMQENPENHDFIFKLSSGQKDSLKIPNYYSTPKISKKNKLKQQIKLSKNNIKNAESSIKRNSYWDGKYKIKITKANEDIPKLEEKLRIEIDKEKQQKKKEKEKLKKERQKAKNLLKKEKEKEKVRKEKEKIREKTKKNLEKGEKVSNQSKELPIDRRVDI